MVRETTPLFPLGRVVATPDALAALEAAGEVATKYLARHQTGNWGDVSDDDKALNDEAVNDGSRILSAYVLSETGQRLWIITEADRSSTCLLLPENY